MADHPQAMADLRGLLSAREPLYALADFTIDTSSAGLDRIVDTIERQLAYQDTPADR
jgi:hypothetical protein